MIYIPAGAAIANWEQRDTIPLVRQTRVPRDGNRGVWTQVLAAVLPFSPCGRSKSAQVLVATTTRPGAGTLSSLRAERSSRCDNVRPAASTDARTQSALWA